MAQLQSPGNPAALAPDGTISFTLSPDIGQERLAGMSLEFDGYDVTQLVEVDGLTVSFRSPNRLLPGDHTLRLIEKVGTSSFVERQRWVVRVAGDGWKDASVTGTLTAQQSLLLAHDLPAGRKETTLSEQAVLDMDARAGGTGWDTALRFNGYFDSQSRHNSDRNNLELGEYLFTARSFSPTVNTAWRLGNHDTGLSNLLVDGFYRRGASVQADFSKAVQVIGFAQDPARATGNTNPSGAALDDQRTEGIFAKVWPFPAFDRRLMVETGYYSGTGTLRGDGATLADDPDNAGQGWTVGAEWQDRAERLKLRGDWAGSRFDEDGSATLVRGIGGNAVRSQINYAPLGTLTAVNEQEQQWILTGLYQKTGSFFRSLANTSLPQDELRAQLSSAYQRRSFTLSNDVYVTQNNTNGLAGVPVYRSYGALAQLSFTPATFDDAADPAGWWPSSQFTAGASFNRDVRQDAPVTYTGPALNQQMMTANAGWTAAFAASSLSLNYVFSRFQDRVDSSFSYVDHLTSLSWTYAPSDRFSVTPAVQYEVNNPAAGESWQQTFASLDASTTIVPGKWLHTFSYATTLDHGTTGTDRHTLSSDLTWQVREQNRNKTGVVLILSGNYQSEGEMTASPSPTEGEDYQVYLRLRLTTPYAY